MVKKLPGFFFSSYRTLANSQPTVRPRLPQRLFLAAPCVVLRGDCGVAVGCWSLGASRYCLALVGSPLLPILCLLPRPLHASLQRQVTSMVEFNNIIRNSVVDTQNVIDGVAGVTSAVASALDSSAQPLGSRDQGASATPSSTYFAVVTLISSHPISFYFLSRATSISASSITFSRTHCFPCDSQLRRIHDHARCPHGSCRYRSGR
jgi:hypothetical protein